MWNGSSNNKLDFLWTVKSVMKKVITRATTGRSLIAKYFTSTFKQSSLGNPDLFLPSWNETLFTVIFVSWAWYVNVSILQIISSALTLLWNAVAAKLELVPHINRSGDACSELDWTLYLPHHGEIKCLEFVVTLQMAYTLSWSQGDYHLKPTIFQSKQQRRFFHKIYLRGDLKYSSNYTHEIKKGIGWKVILVTRLRCTEQIQFTTITNATDEVLDLPYDSKHHGIISILSAI